MRVAALYDIHGNLPALEAVLEDVRAAAVDQVVIGGDVVPGPMPAEALDRLSALDLPVRFIHGNGEVAVLGQRAGADPATLPESAREAVRWSARQLDSDHERLMAGWPKTLKIEIAGLGAVLFCHATPRDENEVFTRLTPEALLLPVFAGLAAALVVCGHTHMQFDRMIGSTRVVNAGSVGMPFGSIGANWLLLGPGVEHRRTPYDLACAAERIGATEYPNVQDFVARFVLERPSEAEMLERFTHATFR